MSAEPVSVFAAVEHPLPARSVAVADGVQVRLPVLPAAVGAPVVVPSVIVIEDPLTTIVEPVKVMFDPA